MIRFKMPLHCIDREFFSLMSKSVKVSSKSDKPFPRYILTPGFFVSLYNGYPIGSPYLPIVDKYDAKPIK